MFDHAIVVAAKREKGQKAAWQTTKKIETLKHRPLQIVCLSDNELLAEEPKDVLCYK